jgi:MFS family permease
MWNVSAPFWGWAIASALLGLGFTFFSGATEAWLVDALTASGYTKDLETIFGRAQMVAGGAMLAGTVLGGVIAQLTDLGVPYIVRAAMLGITLLVAWWFMHDIGFKPDREASPVTAVKTVVRGAVNGGLRNAPVRWLMLAAPFSTGVGFYAFYAFQPYLLELYGDPNAYSIAGLAAAIVAGAQILGGFAVPLARRLFARRTHFLIGATAASVLLLAAIGLTDSFVVALVVLTAWCVIAAIEEPMRRAFINPLIPTEQRATVLSFDSLMGSSGGVVIQPVLGRTADAFGYGTSYLAAAGIQALALPFTLLARREDAPSDPISAVDVEPAAVGEAPVA